MALPTLERAKPQAQPPQQPKQQPQPRPAEARPPDDLARARWVEGRIAELPKYCMFLYTLLLDRNLPDPFKEQVFGALWYVLEGGDLLPPDEENLAGVDAMAFAYRCMTELVARLPQANLAVYEETLHRDGVPLRDRVCEAPLRIGEFYRAIAAIYRGRIAKSLPVYKNAIQTGQLVKILRSFMQLFRPAPWSRERLEHLEAFLASFRLPGGR